MNNDSSIKSLNDLFDTGLALEAMLITLIDAGCWDHQPLPIYERETNHLEDELEAALGTQGVV